MVNGGGAFAHPADGSILRIGAATTNATAQPGISSSAEASVRALAVSILGGEIAAQTIVVRSGAAAGPAGATGDVGRSTITGLVVLGQAVTPSGNIQLPLADWGTLDVLGVSSSTSDDPRSAESSVTGLRVRLNAEHAGLPGGTEIVVGATTAVAVAQAAPSTPAKPPKQGGAGPPAPGRARRTAGRPVAPRRTRPASRAAPSRARRPRSFEPCRKASPPASRRAATCSPSSGRPPSATRSALSAATWRASGTTARTSSPRAERRFSPSRTGISSPSAGTTSAAGASGSATTEATSSTTRTSMRTRPLPSPVGG